MAPSIHPDSAHAADSIHAADSGHAANPALPTESTLFTLLAANRRIALSCKGTTNHCPMALVALAEMGADGARLAQFFAYWEQKYALPAADTVTPVAREHWQSELGGNNFTGLQQCFIDWIDEAGIDPVLQAVLQTIPFAPSSGAFHALIRLAYGLSSQYIPEIAAGLAYLVVNNLALPALPEAAACVAHPDMALAILSQAMAGSQYPGPSIVGRLRAVAADARFAPALRQVPLTPDFLAQLAQIAIAAYWQTNNFTVLHMVTSMHAARLVLARLPGKWHPRLLSELWLAVCAAYVSVGAPALTAPQSLIEKLNPDQRGGEQEWASLLARAILSNNDHVIKMTYSCHQEHLQYRSPLYFAAAKRLVERGTD